MKPLPVPVPLDYAEALQYHPSNLGHINAGRRKLGPKWRILKVMNCLTENFPNPVMSSSSPWAKVSFIIPKSRSTIW
jgi:hypothetical protein